MSQPFLQANVGIGVNKAGDAADAATPADTPDTSASSGGTHDPAEKIHNVIIVGSGPAGYTAAIYAARAELEPIVFEGMDFGGLLMQTTEVENFPGFAKGIQGPELMDEMRNQAERFGADLRMEDVEKMDLSGEIKKVSVDGEEYQARAVILATGAAPRYLNIPGEQEMIGRGVSACATCDGFFFKDRKIAIVGGGDSAMEEADFLTKLGETVTLIHRRDEFRASKIIQERARQNPKIEFLMNSKVTDVHGENAVTSLTIEDTLTGESQEMEFDALVVAIGHDPRVGVFEGQVELKEDGYVKVAEPSTATSLPGVFAAGDLVNSHYQQAITAAGSGCRAALDAEHYLAALPANEGENSTPQHTAGLPSFSGIHGILGQGKPPVDHPSPRTTQPRKGRARMSNIITVTQQTFKSTVVESDLPVLVDFWAQWCQPCLRMNPTLEELAEEMDGRAVVAKVNVDEERALAAMFQV